MSGTWASTSSARSRAASERPSAGTISQQFSLSSTLNLDLNYASNTAVIRGNAIDPLQNTQQITSSLNYSKRLSLGRR